MRRSVSFFAPDSQELRDSVLVAYTESLRDVYVIGIPCGILAALGALCIKNSRMQTKAEELAAIEAAKEKAALEIKDKGQTESPAEAGAEMTGQQPEVKQVASRFGSAVAELDAAPPGGKGTGLSSEDEEEPTLGDERVEREIDAQVVLAETEGRSAV